MPYMRMKHAVDPAKQIVNELGDLSDIGLFRNLVLVAIYVRPTQTASGIHLSDKTTEEDKHQGKVGLIVKAGPQAFVDPENKWFDGNPPKVGDWVFFRPAESWAINVHGVACRILEDIDLKGPLKFPDGVW